MTTASMQPIERSDPCGIVAATCTHCLVLEQVHVLCGEAQMT